MSQNIDSLRYPIGIIKFPLKITSEHINKYIADLRALPSELISAVDGLNEEQLNTPYREGGWTIKQVVHHIADSHMNGYIRVKWALTEDEPLIKAYEQDEWVKLKDTGCSPVSASIKLIDGLHERWANLVEALSEEELNKKLKHPENSYDRVSQIICVYAWHGKHHTAHITSLRNRMGW